MSILFGSSESLRPLERLPASCRHFQVPVFMHDGEVLHLAYYIEPQDDDRWQAGLARDPSAVLVEGPHALLRFHGTVHFLIERYDDDMVGDHRLGALGLEPFSQVEVENSQLIEALRARQEESAVRQHRLPADLHHFVFTMHGHLIEVVASGFEYKREFGSLIASLASVVAGPARRVAE